MPQPSSADPAGGRGANAPTHGELYRHLRDEDVPEAFLERSVGEGWSIRAIYDDQLARGLIQPI